MYIYIYKVSHWILHQQYPEFSLSQVTKYFIGSAGYMERIPKPKSIQKLVIALCTYYSQKSFQTVRQNAKQSSSSHTFPSYNLISVNLTSFNIHTGEVIDSNHLIHRR